MPVIEVTTFITAPIERVFDLARSIDLHTASTARTGERAIAGVMSGLMGAGQEVTWRARHFGVWQNLTVRMTRFERPTCFQDEMTRGTFRRMDHHHSFTASQDGTVMRDIFSYESPLGLLGQLADRLFLERYLRQFLLERNQVIKRTAESSAWQKYLPNV